VNRILLVEDSATVRKLVEICARKRNFALDTAANGKDALARVAESRPDAIVLDFQLPDMDGVQLCERLSADPRTASIPIVVSSGKGPALLQRFQQFPAVRGLLPKPFTEADLLESLRQVAHSFASGSSQPAPTPSGETAPHPFARILAEVLQPELARIPALEQRRGGEPPGPWYAQKLLTPAVLAALAERLAPPKPSIGSESQLSSRWPRPDAILERAPRSTQGTRPLQSRENRVLGLLDGKRTVEQLTRLSALPLPELQAVLRALVAAGAAVITSESSLPPLRDALICDPDASGFVQPLQRLCAALENPVELRPVARQGLEAALRERAPELVLCSDPEAEGLVAQARAIARLAPRARPVALLSPSQLADEAALLEAGFARVLRKPAPEAELISLFTESPALAAGQERPCRRSS
jgi:CheY-like chemotaxis protein